MSSTTNDTAGRARRTLSIDPVRLQPHPYATELPPLTDEERAALKADIKANGVLYPPVVDEDNQVLDGVHRAELAAELGLPKINATRLNGLTDEQKREYAYGLNLRRRHLDKEARKALVRKLGERGLSLRQIEKITGFGKSTIQRDLNPQAERDNAAKNVVRATAARAADRVATPTVPNGTPPAEGGDDDQPEQPTGKIVIEGVKPDKPLPKKPATTDGKPAPEAKKANRDERMEWVNDAVRGVFDGDPHDALEDENMLRSIGHAIIKLEDALAAAIEADPAAWKGQSPNAKVAHTARLLEKAADKALDYWTNGRVLDMLNERASSEAVQAEPVLEAVDADRVGIDTPTEEVTA